MSQESLTGQALKRALEIAIAMGVPDSSSPSSSAVNSSPTNTTDTTVRTPIEELDTFLADSMTQPKIWYTSKRAWAGIATILQSVLLIVCGIELPSEMLESITTVGLGVGTLAAGILGLYGAMKAQGPVVMKKAAVVDARIKASSQLISHIRQIVRAELPENSND